MAVPASVAIIGLGPSCESYVDLCKRLGGRRAFSDETWVINSLGDVIACDRIFHMDDVRIQEIRAKERPQSNIAKMLQWMRAHPGPIYTSRTHEDYPGLVEYPLEDVLNTCKIPYLNNTSAYAIAYAVHIGVKAIKLFGCDFTYPNAADAERGRACAEFWLGFAHARGISIGLPDRTTLMDSIYPQQDRLYGQDTRSIAFTHEGDRLKLEFTEVETLPTAAEIEARYDHSLPVNVLVRRGQVQAA